MTKRIDSKLLVARSVRVVIDVPRQYLVPKFFYENFDLAEYGLAAQEFRELADPDHNSYWDAWEFLLHHARRVDADGVAWRLAYDDNLLFEVSELLLNFVELGEATVARHG